MTTYANKQAVAVARVKKIISDLQVYERITDGFTIYFYEARFSFEVVDRNYELFRERQQEMSAVRGKINDEFMPLILAADNEDKLTQALDKVSLALSNGLQSNAKLSAKHGKVHGSWHEARLAGNGLWWSFVALVTGSRAARVYQDSLSAIDKLTHELLDKPKQKNNLFQHDIEPPVAQEIKAPTYENTTVVLNEMLRRLKSYLNKFSYQVLTKEEKGDNTYDYVVEKNNKFYVMLGEVAWKDTMLSLQRIANMHTIYDELSALLISPELKRQNVSELENTFAKVWVTLQDVCHENTRLSSLHGKNHRSSQYCKAQNEGWFCTTWKQSTAEQALVACTSYVEQFSKRFGFSLDKDHPMRSDRRVG